MTRKKCETKNHAQNNNNNNKGPQFVKNLNIQIQEMEEIPNTQRNPCKSTS